MQKIQTERFYKMDKALQLVEGTTVAAFWGHLIDAYNYFVEKKMITTENTMFQSAKAIHAFTGIGVKAQGTARKRLKEMGFLVFKVAAIPGQATKSTFYILFPDTYKEWTDKNEFDQLRDDKYHDLQDPAERDKLDDWIKENMDDAHKQTLKRMNQKQKSTGTFANPTDGHLQTIPTDICKCPKDTVIETILIETLELENTQKSKDGCVYSGQPYPYIKGKTNSELLDMVIEDYTEAIVQHHPDYVSKNDFDKDRYIGNLDVIDKEFSELEISAAANFYIGILGYLDDLEEQLLENESKFKAAHKLENLLKFNRKIVLSRENINRGERIAKAHYAPSKPEKSL